MRNEKDATEEPEDKEGENIERQSQRLEDKKDLQDEEEAGLLTSFCREISKSCKEIFSIKSKVKGLVKKKPEDLAWRNFIRC